MKLFTPNDRLIQRQVGVLGAADREGARKAVLKRLDQVRHPRVGEDGSGG
jgi:hypothetical protein